MTEYAMGVRLISQGEKRPLLVSHLGEGAKILVVDDEARVRGLISAILRRSGYRADLATNGPEALDLLRRQVYDLVITDLKMPGMSGIALLKEIKAHWPDTDVIMLSGHATIESAVEATKLGAYDYLTKPFTVEELQLKVHNCLERRALERKTKRLSAVVSLSELSQALTSNLDIESLPAQIIKIVRSSFQPEKVSLVINDDNVSNTPFVIESSNQDDTHQNDIQQESILTKAQETALPFEIQETKEGSTITVPLKHGNRFLGTLCISRDSGQPHYTREDGRLLALFGAQIAIALENAMAYRGLKELNLATITALVTAVEMRDKYTRGHSERVARYVTQLARKVGLPSDSVEELRIAGLLHDIGKIGVSDLILNKPGKLTAEEFQQVKEHPAIGARIVGGVKPLQKIVPLIYHHHERWDGTGYPDGLAGENIPLGARMLAVADAFEAMTSNRAYRAALGLDESLHRLQAGAGKQWDPSLVRTFVEIITHEDQTVKGILAS